MDKLRLILRSIYLKGHQDALNKTADVVSWEDDIVNKITKLFEKEKSDERNSSD